MPDTLVTAIASQGITGVLLVVAGGVIYRLYGQLLAEQKAHAEALAVQTAARIADRDAHQAQLLQLAQATTAALANSTTASGGVHEALDRLTDALAAQSDEMRRERGSRPGGARRAGAGGGGEGNTGGGEGRR